MPDPIITNNKTYGVTVWDPVFDDAVLVDATGSLYLAGTLLGRITASGKLTAYTVGATDGSEVPIAVLKDELTLQAATNYSARPIISGRLRRNQLVAHGIGAVNQTEVDQLRDYSIIALSSTALYELDNQ